MRGGLDVAAVLPGRGGPHAETLKTGLPRGTGPVNFRFGQVRAAAGLPQSIPPDAGIGPPGRSRLCAGSLRHPGFARQQGRLHGPGQPRLTPQEGHKTWKKARGRAIARPAPLCSHDPPDGRRWSVFSFSSPSGSHGGNPCGPACRRRQRHRTHRRRRRHRQHHRRHPRRRRHRRHRRHRHRKHQPHRRRRRSRCRRRQPAPRRRRSRTSARALPSSPCEEREPCSSRSSSRERSHTP